MEENNENWIPVGSELVYRTLKERDEFIIGVLIEKNISSKFKGQENYVIETSPGIRICVTGTMVLTNKMQAVGIGQKVKIVCLGEQKSTKSKFNYMDFAVYTEGKK